MSDRTIQWGFGFVGGSIGGVLVGAEVHLAVLWAILINLIFAFISSAIRPRQEGI